MIGACWDANPSCVWPNAKEVSEMIVAVLICFCAARAKANTPRYSPFGPSCETSYENSRNFISAGGRAGSAKAIQGSMPNGMTNRQRRKLDSRRKCSLIRKRLAHVHVTSQHQRTLLECPLRAGECASARCFQCRKILDARPPPWPRVCAQTSELLYALALGTKWWMKNHSAYKCRVYRLTHPYTVTSVLIETFSKPTISAPRTRSQSVDLVAGRSLPISAYLGTVGAPPSICCCYLHR
jgi:hypothetical protein